MNDRDLVACALAPSDLRGRRERWLRLSHHALLEKEPIQAGVLLRFQRLEGVEAELRELAALERDCCSFATWSVTGEATELHLQVAAEGEGIAAVRALFDEPWAERR
jgi:hypothetical protein